MQSTNTILMVKPSGFRFNEETALNNHFQMADESQTVTQIQHNAVNEFHSMVSLLQKNGIEVLGVFAIFSYDLEVAKSNFEKANQKFYSLSDFSTLIKCSKKHMNFSQEDLDKVNSWKKSPTNWIV